MPCPGPFRPSRLVQRFRPRPRGGGPRPGPPLAGAGDDPRAAGGHSPVVPVRRPGGGRRQRLSLCTGGLGVLTACQITCDSNYAHFSTDYWRGFMRLVLFAIAYFLGTALNASAAEIKSISRLAAGPDNVLFVADWKTARVHAIDLPRVAQKPAGAVFNILDLEALLSKQVGGARITVEDMVVRPGTAEVYVAVSYGAAK